MPVSATSGSSVGFYSPVTSGGLRELRLLAYRPDQQYVCILSEVSRNEAECLLAGTFQQLLVKFAQAQRVAMSMLLHIHIFEPPSFSVINCLSNQYFCFQPDDCNVGR